MKLLSFMSLRGVVGLTALFGLINALVRRLAGNNLAMDDAKTYVFTQVWQWGYQPDNPPLFEWLIKLLEPITGGGLASFLLLKYAGLTLAAAFVYATADRLSDRKTAFVTAIAMVLLYQIGWNFHQAFTHSALLLPAVAGLMWATVRTYDQPGWRYAITLGCVMGISLLTKYNAALTMIGLGVAVLILPVARKRFLKPIYLLPLGIAGLILLPHILWFTDQSAAYQETLEGTLALEGGYVERVTGGLVALVIGVGSFFVPWALVAFWLKPDTGTSSLKQADSRVILLLLASVIQLGLLLASIFLFGIGDISERYLIPVLLPGYVGMKILLLQARPETIKWIWGTAGFAALIILIRLYGYLFPGPPFCDLCGQFVPYSALQEPIEENLPEDSILIVRDENTAGNLVSMFPNMHVRAFTSLTLLNPITKAGLPCYLVWSEDMVGGVPLEPWASYAYDHPHTIYVDADWKHVVRGNGWRTTRWGITPVTDQKLIQSFCSPAE